MASTTVITRSDDIDGTAGAENIIFGIDGAAYEIDLSEENAGALREALAPYVAAGRRVVAQRARRQRPVSSGLSAADIRAWAAENGVPCAPRGRLSPAVRAQFEAAQSGSAPSAAAESAAA